MWFVFLCNVMLRNGSSTIYQHTELNCIRLYSSLVLGKAKKQIRYFSIKMKRTNYEIRMLQCWCWFDHRLFYYYPHRMCFITKGSWVQNPCTHSFDTKWKKWTEKSICTALHAHFSIRKSEILQQTSTGNIINHF